MMQPSLIDANSSRKPRGYYDRKSYGGTPLTVVGHTEIAEMTTPLGDEGYQQHPVKSKDHERRRSSDPGEPDLLLMRPDLTVAELVDDDFVYFAELPMGTSGS